MGLKIIGTGRAVPQKAVSNQEISTIVDTSDDWITSRTGVKNRYVCTTESLTELCIEAANKALSTAQLDAADIDMLICSTISGDYVTPSLSCAVAEELNISCPAFDINAACSGFVYALDIASTYLTGSKAKNILIICAEMMSKHVDWNDRATCVLFGDGAGACVAAQGSALNYIHLTSSGNTSVLGRRNGTGNNPFRPQMEPGYLYMQGKEVFKFAVSMAESETQLALDTLSWHADDVDYFLLHQANKRIIDFTRQKLNQPQDKFPYNVDRYGNVSSASVLILLDELLENNRIKTGDRLLLSTFGAGLTTGTCAITWE